MDWLLLPTPTPGSVIITAWFIGLVGGYCFGRAHAAWIAIRNFIEAHKQ